VDHHDHVALLRGGIPEPGGLWADLGSGTGAFTLALAELVGPQGRIISVDKDRSALAEQERALKARFPDTNVEYRTGDFTKRLDLVGVDGIVMANSLHYVRHKDPVLTHLKAYLKPGGRLIVVEYNVDHGNMWVPHPFSYSTWEKLAAKAGFSHTDRIGSHPSSFLREFYSAVSW
jgi:ubiquinone/menaquinone biosynthesis C-methylase UbiE